MSWARYQELFLNVSRPRGPVLFRSASDSSDGSIPNWVIGDAFPLRLRFLTLSASGQPHLETLDAGDVILVGGRVKRGTGALLFSASAFTAVSAGGDTYYQATLDLTTAELVAAIGTATQLQVQIDIEVQNAANTQRTTLTLTANIIAQSYQPGDSEPSPAEPAYPAAAALALRVPENGAYRIVGDGADGWVFQLKDKTTGDFRTLFLDNGALALGPAVS